MDALRDEQGAGRQMARELARVAAERDQARVEIERMNAALRKIADVAETLKV